MTKTRWKYFSGGLLIALAGCTAAQAAELFSYVAIQLPFAPANSQPWAEVITTQEQWQAFYARNLPNSSPSVTAPSIDFANYRVVVGGLGPKPTTGYTLVVERMVESSNDIFMSLLDVSFGLNGQFCGSGQMVTYPYVAVLIKKSEKPIRVTVEKALTACR